MAITRKLVSVTVTFDAAGATSTEAQVAITDDVEETSTGLIKRFNAPRIKTAADALRDEIVQQFAGQGRPVTF